MDTATLAVRLLLAAVFGVAALSKLRDPAASRATLQGFGVQDPLARIGGLLLAPSELAVAVALMVAPTALWGAIGAALLLVVFIAGIVNALRQGRRPDCGCFGALRPTPVGRSTLVRNGVLLVAAAFVAIAGPGPAIGTWISARSVGALVVTGLVVVGIAAAFLRALASSGSAGLGADVGASAPDYPWPELGQLAPEFNLEDAHGETHTLAGLRASGRPVVLVFGNSGCGSCRSLFPHLGRWQVALADRLQIAVVGIGDLEATRTICTEYGVEEVLADGDGEVWRAYGALGNPAAVSVAPDGTIANGPAVGQDAIEDLIRLTLHRYEPMPHT